MSANRSWTHEFCNSFTSCLCLRKSQAPPSDDEEQQQEGASERPAHIRQAIARDELEGLLNSNASEDESGTNTGGRTRRAADTLSLHSDVGRRGGPKKKKKKKSNAWGITGRHSNGGPRTMQLFGFYIFGKPDEGRIALSESDDDDGTDLRANFGSAALEHDPSRSSISLAGGNISDATPLDTEDIARIASSQWAPINDEDEDGLPPRLPRPHRPSPTVTPAVPQNDAPIVNLAQEQSGESTPASTIASPIPPVTSTSDEERAAAQAKAIRRAKREQRKRLKEEAQRRAREEEERRAEQAAGGFGDVDDGPDAFGPFVQPQTGRSRGFSNAQTLTSTTSSTQRSKPSVSDDEESPDDDDADYGAEYATRVRSKKRSNKGSASGGTSDRSHSATRSNPTADNRLVFDISQANQYTPIMSNVAPPNPPKKSKSNRTGSSRGPGSVRSHGSGSRGGDVYRQALHNRSNSLLSPVTPNTSTPQKPHGDFEGADFGEDELAAASFDGTPGGFDAEDILQPSAQFMDHSNDIAPVENVWGSPASPSKDPSALLASRSSTVTAPQTGGGFPTTGFSRPRVGAHGRSGSSFSKGDLMSQGARMLA